MFDFIPFWVFLVFIVPLAIGFFILMINVFVGLAFKLFEDDRPKAIADSKKMDEKVNAETPKAKRSHEWGNIPKGKKEEWWQ